PNFWKAGPPPRVAIVASDASATGKPSSVRATARAARLSIVSRFFASGIFATFAPLSAYEVALFNKRISQEIYTLLSVAREKHSFSAPYRNLFQKHRPRALDTGRTPTFYDFLCQGLLLEVRVLSLREF